MFNFLSRMKPTFFDKLPIKYIIYLYMTFVSI